MSQRDNRRVLLSDFKARKEEEGAIDIETDDGTVFHVPPPELWPDDFQAIAEDNLAFATALIGGPEQYAQFVEKGGSALLLLSLIKERHGAEAGELSASSRS
jgi:hypothetical protein